MNIIKGDATQPQDTPTILMHICNIQGGWGAGFVLALSKKWKLPEQEYRNWFKTKDHFELGSVQFVGVGGNITVANMLAQDGFGGVAIKYDALRACLKKVYLFANKNQMQVVAPKIGAGLGGGDWNVIQKIIQDELGTLTVTIYTI